jgi:hypothetical protein
MMASECLKLFPHGILTENSDIRAHVALGTRAIYVFKTSYAIELIRSRSYPSRPACQPGVLGITAMGIIVPWKDIPDIRRIQYLSERWWESFSEQDTTTVKGKKACDVVAKLLKMGRFPLWCTEPANDTKNIELQIKGTDVLLWGKWRIQVKCDYKAGEGGSGNLFLQTEERNPLKRH